MSLYRQQAHEDLSAREMENIRNRRARLEERTKRVLDAKTRTMGVDVNALNEQVRERQGMDEMEGRRNTHYDSLSNQYASILNDQESMRQLETGERNIQIANFRHQQAKEKRRKDEADAASYKEYAKNQSSFLNFAGEDLNKPARDKYDQAQQREWLSKQMAMLSDKNNFEAQEDANYEAQQARINDQRKNIEMEAAIERRLRNLDQKNYNKHQALHKRNSDLAWRNKQEKLNNQEIAATMNSKFMNEGVSDMDGPSGFKGFTTAQRQRVLDEQAMQIAQKTAVRERELGYDQAYDRAQDSLQATLAVCNDKKSAMEQSERMRLRKEREVQAREKKLRYDYLDSVVYTNPVKEEFFQQFGQGCR